MNIKKRLRQQAKQLEPPELSESELLFCKSVFEAAQQPNGSTCAAVKKRQNLIIIFSCAAALLTALIITLSIVLPKKPGNSLPSYFDKNIVISDCDLNSFKNNVTFCDFSLEHVNFVKVDEYSDSVSCDKLFYRLLFEDYDNLIILFQMDVVINQYYNYKYFGTVVSQYTVPEGYTICYEKPVIKDFEITFTGFLKVKTEEVYFSCTQFLLPDSSEADAEKIFIKNIQNIVKLK